MKSNIYVACFESGIKVGKADNVPKRIKQLEKSHGSPSKVTSYCVDKNIALLVEKRIHKNLINHAIDLDTNLEGWTEFYSKNSRQEVEDMVVFCISTDGKYRRVSARGAELV